MVRVFSFIKNYIGVISGFIVILCLISFLALSARGKLITNQFLDPLRTTNARDEARIVGIDDKSLQSIGAWPWDRSIFAKVTDNLNAQGAKVILYDILFLESRSGDEDFKKSLDNSIAKVVLSSKNDNGRYLKSYLSDSGALAQVTPDSDGKVRSYPNPKIIGSTCIDTLTDSAFNLFTHKQFNCSTKSSYFRYPLNIPTVSIKDVLDNNIPAGFFKNKVIFIGSNSLDLEDHFVGMNGEKVPGVYVHASIFTSLLNGVEDRTLTDLYIVFFILVYSIIFSFFIYRAKSLSSQLFVSVGFLILITLVTLLSFNLGFIIPFPWFVFVTILLGGYISGFKFIKERKQNQYIQSLFSKYVHKDVLSELMKSSTSLRFDGEKREMSILFSDIRGFTSFSETMTPEELTKLLNAYLSAMTPAILEEKGTIDKFIGDAIMAFWNAPLYVENHTTHAVRAGLRMEKALKNFNEKHKSNLAVGIGIHFGNVVVGNVGSEERVNYTILGDAVNLASRVEGLTKKYGVGLLVTEEAKEKVNDKNIIFRKLDVITVKGKTTPTVLYEADNYNKDRLEIFKKYEEGLSFYQSGDFDKAEAIFKEIGDKPATVMLERIPILRNDKTWNGVWHFDEK